MSAIAKSQEEVKLLGSFENSLISQGFKVVDLDVRMASRSLVRLYIDRVQGGGVSIDDCATVSRLISPLVDEQLHGRYDLEVSSPGIDRRLRTREDFQGVVGEIITLKLQAEVEGLGKTVHGTLSGVSEDGLEIVVNGKPTSLVFSNVRQANLKR